MSRGGASVSLSVTNTHTLTYTRAAAAAFPLLSWYPSDTEGRKIQIEIGTAELIERKCNLQEFPAELTPPSLSKLSPPAPSHVCLHIRRAAYLLFYSWGFFKKEGGIKDTSYCREWVPSMALRSNFSQLNGDMTHKWIAEDVASGLFAFTFTYKPQDKCRVPDVIKGAELINNSMVLIGEMTSEVWSPVFFQLFQTACVKKYNLYGESFTKTTTS